MPELWSYSVIAGWRKGRKGRKGVFDVCSVGSLNSTPPLSIHGNSWGIDPAMFQTNARYRAYDRIGRRA